MRSGLIKVGVQLISVKQCVKRRVDLRRFPGTSWVIAPREGASYPVTRVVGFLIDVGFDVGTGGITTHV